MSEYVMGESHTKAERLGPYRDINYYLDNTDKEVYFVIRHPFDRYVSGLQRDLFFAMVEGKTIDDVMQDRLNNWYHGYPILQYVKDKDFKIIPYNNVSNYINAENDENFAADHKSKYLDMILQYANKVDLQAELDAYDFIFKTKKILEPDHFKKMVSDSKFVNYVGSKVNKEPLWDM